MQKKFTKKQAQDLAKRLSKKSVLVWDKLTRAQTGEAMALAEDYKRFLDQGKTEREAVAALVSMAAENGFAFPGKKGRGLCMPVSSKVLALYLPGKESPMEGLNIIASHLDSPRLDCKQNPLYECVDLVFLKTHYYGGIRKHQWLARPLAIHGRIVKTDGSYLDLAIGEDPDDPVFTILDLLPHLARKVQANKKLFEAFDAEKLNILLGSMPLGPDDVKDRFKLAMLHLLHDKYGLVEEDFLAGELEVVPAGKARDVGLDRSLIGAYGHDDRVCAYASASALFAQKTPRYGCLALFFDKEEIGSEGRTSAKSRVLEHFVEQVLEAAGVDASGRNVRKCLYRSRALSADVNAALDPDYQDVHEKQNAARMGYGVCVTKFTGSGGKSGANDASAEYMGQVRKIFDKNKVIWQTGELGKVDIGGGGTIAKFLAAWGMDIVDCGTAVLSMHSPFEIVSKADLYMTRQAYSAFFADCAPMEDK
ncbi:MAG: aminopeptidase [Deltaproteobacteria bacterium]|nr:aminopeptidase [Deltaproteobacteria bacterium]